MRRKSPSKPLIHLREKETKVMTMQKMTIPIIGFSLLSQSLESKFLRLVDLASQVARTSMMKFKHGALIQYKNKIFTACNDDKTPGRQYRRFMLSAWSTHAEIAVIQEFLKEHSEEELKLATLIVVRSASQTVGNSKPCCNCEKFMRLCGLKTVYYSL